MRENDQYVLQNLVRFSDSFFMITFFFLCWDYYSESDSFPASKSVSGLFYSLIGRLYEEKRLYSSPVTTECLG